MITFGYRFWTLLAKDSCGVFQYASKSSSVYVWSSAMAGLEIHGLCRRSSRMPLDHPSPHHHPEPEALVYHTFAYRLIPNPGALPSLNHMKS